MKTAFLIALPEEVDGANELHGIPVFYSGVGKINAALKAMEVIHQGYEQIINIGSCGSVKHSLGEIVQVGSVLQDIDGRPICEYGLTPFEERSDRLIIDADISATCFTTDYFYDHLQKNKYSPEYLQRVEEVSVFDMELFAIAKACQRNNVSLKAFKWVSDDGNFAHWQENCRISAARVLEMLHV